MFRTSGIKLGTLFGIPIYLHPTWFLIWLLLTISWGQALNDSLDSPALMNYAISAVTALVIFATLLAHEYGHALTARRFGIETDRITLFMLGGVAQIKDEPRAPLHELLIAIAGPAVSVACMALFGVPYLLLKSAGAPPMLLFFFQELTLLNLGFAVFNMIPGFPMDGGRVFRAAVWWFTGDYLTATKLASIGGQIFSFVLMAGGAFMIFQGALYGLVLIMLGVFLNKLARLSLQHARYKSAFDSVLVRDLMRPVQAVVPAEMPVSSVVRDYIYRIHGDRFPVVRGNSLLGYISADEISRLDRSQWDQTRAEQLAKPYGRGEILAPDQSAFGAFQKVLHMGRPQLPVFHGRKLIGYLFRQDAATYFQRFGDGRSG